MDKALTELVKISNAVGRDSSLVLDRFGDVSVKTAAGLCEGSVADAKRDYSSASGEDII